MSARKAAPPRNLISATVLGLHAGPATAGTSLAVGGDVQTLSLV